MRAGNWATTAALVIVSAWLAGCSDGRTASDGNARYACKTNADCLSGFTCGPCGYCQVAGEAPLGCDAAATDSGPETADAGPDTAPDAPADIPGDVASGPCNLSDWTPCASGSGCYYNPADKKTFCEPHGSLAENASCNPATPQLCGKAGTRPLLCDTVDKKCYRTCRCDQPTLLPCPSGQKCYCLEANGVPWPGSAGICAP